MLLPVRPGCPCHIPGALGRLCTQVVLVDAPLNQRQPGVRPRHRMRDLFAAQHWESNGICHASQGFGYAQHGGYYASQGPGNALT